MIRIPKAFYDDHDARDLPTPVIRGETRRHYWIEPLDPAVAELASDAEHYAEGGIRLRDFPELVGLVASARATPKAIRRHEKGGQA